MKRVAIIGGGLSGLSAAYQLARDAHAEFTLFEASARLGGIVETVRQDGFVIECGPDSWVSEKPLARELASELGLAAEIIPSNDLQRHTYLLHQNQLVPMPDGMRMMVPTQLAPVMESPLFSERAKQAYQREPERANELKASALKENEDESVASFVRRHFGDEVTRTVAAPLLSGVFGGDIDTLSVRAVMPAFVKMEREHGSLTLALQSRQNAAEHSVFTTVRSGLGTLIDRMAATLPSECVRLSEQIIAVTQKNEGWRIRTVDAEEIFDAVIIATPAHVTRQLLRGVDDGFADLLGMEATSAIVVALAFSPEQARALSVPRGFGYLVPQHDESDSQLLACTFVDQKFSHRVPEGGILLRAFFGAEAATALLSESDEALTALALRRLSEALGSLTSPHIAVVRRWPWSLPQYRVGHLERMAQLESLAAGFHGLRLAGNAYYGVGLPDMIRIGREAARRITHD
jgi:protoporphyrinogen/coproporphyrinogen III oxidase